jgi:hypothetical protein
MLPKFTPRPIAVAIARALVDAPGAASFGNGGYVLMSGIGCGAAVLPPPAAHAAAISIVSTSRAPRRQVCGSTGTHLAREEQDDSKERSMREEGATAERLAAYSDAVFAVIVTVMVLELKAPEQPALRRVVRVHSHRL